MRQEIKAHLARHKTAYLIGAGIGLAGITYAIIGGRIEPCSLCRGSIRSLALRGDLNTIVGNTTLVNRPFMFFSRQIVNVVAREGRGHPGYLTRCLETGDIFRTQGEAARWADTYNHAMSRHLAGNVPEINGYHFERISALV